MKKTLEFYWYPKCSTCRKAKAQLDSQNVAYTAIDLKENPPTKEQFLAWFAQEKFPVKKFFNTSGLVYREMQLKDKLSNLTESEMAELLSSNGMLVKRPLLVRSDELLQIGYKAEDYKKLR